MAKWMWIIAGPNGAGKSSFADVFLDKLGHPNLVKLNADELTVRLRQAFPDGEQDALNLQAAIEIDKKVVDCIAADRSFVVETVLSSGKYRDDVIAAKDKGFKFGLIYVSLFPPELSPQRVSERAAKGGHDVEPSKAIERHARSHDELTWFAPQADILMVFDNSSENATPILIAYRMGEQPVQLLAPGINPAVDHALGHAAARKQPPSPGPG